jgi:HAD superfamily hydrolase (TIGR01458 family)
VNDLFSSVDAIMVDIDGVLTIGSEVIPGAPEALQTLRARGIAIRYVTNSTIYSRETLCERMEAMGFPVQLGEVFTATYAAAEYLRTLQAKSFFPLLLPDAQLEFAGIDIDDENPEFVVVGDLGASFTFTRLNKAFRALLNGAQLVALHKKRYWRTEQGLFLDAGPFVVALEYAAEVGAVVVGKPNPAYFRMVLDDLGLPPERVAIIGDDIESDIRGAQKVGMQGWLVKTGKFRREDLAKGIWPDRIFDDIGGVVNSTT